MTESLPARVGAVLSRIRNPRLDNDLLSAGMIRDLEVTPEGRVSFTFLLSRAESQPFINNLFAVAGYAGGALAGKKDPAG